MISNLKSHGLFALGVIICFSVAGLSVLVEKLVPGDLLGASLSVNVIMSMGKMTFFVMIFTFAMCFGGGYFVRKLFGLNWKLSNLISAGTGICGFLALAIINSVGFIPAQVSGAMKAASKFLMVTALAAIGLNTSITEFKKAGLTPMFYGITIDTLVTLTALAVIWCMGLM